MIPIEHSAGHTADVGWHNQIERILLEVRYASGAISRILKSCKGSRTVTNIFGGISLILLHSNAQGRHHFGEEILILRWMTREVSDMNGYE